MDNTSTVVKIVLWAEALLAFLIVALALNYYLQGSSTDAARTSSYEAVVINTLLPLFTATITAVLTWVFAKPVVQAVVARLMGVRA